MAKRKSKRTSRRPPQLVEIYENIEEVFARKGPRSLWPNKPFKHKFKKGAAIYGVRKGGQVKLRAGDLVVRSRKGNKLWKMFQYEKE